VFTVPFLGRMRGGYRLLHLSNAGLAAQNPGLNANLWFLGWSR
jgi:lipid A 3-O-deacylase PagL